MNLFALHAIIGGVMALAAYLWLTISFQVWKKAKRNIWPTHQCDRMDSKYHTCETWCWEPHTMMPLWVMGPILFPFAWLPAIVLGGVGYSVWLLCGGLANRIVKRGEKREKVEKEKAAEVNQLKADLAKARAEVESWVSAAARKQAEEIVKVPIDKSGNPAWDAFAAEVMRSHAD